MVIVGRTRTTAAGDVANKDRHLPAPARRTRQWRALLRGGAPLCQTSLDSSDEIAPHFAETDFDQQRKLLRDSVSIMVGRDAAVPVLGVVPSFPVTAFDGAEPVAGQTTERRDKDHNIHFGNRKSVVNGRRGTEPPGAPAVR